jgi:STE24 endopeptidase
MKLPHGNILAILGHELGHWKKSHTLYGLVLSSVQMFVWFFVIGTVLYSDAAPVIFEQFGFAHGTHSVMIGITLISLLLEPIEQVLERKIIIMEYLCC